ncbi:MAG: MBL fold metallo-hydrolase [Oscillibacter sp.]|jgi:glyoxylase-like metal-dependent hydrolase (beta-lactamase superfamily II)|nr:MBL fold metallo-hydrolase [Oscillibacter sp.]
MKIATLQVGSIGTNCYIVCDEEKKLCAVIDPGDDGARVAERVRETGCAPVCILLTHSHYDHVGGVEELLAACPGLPVYLNSRDLHPSDSPRARFLFPTLPFETVNYDDGDTVRVGDLTFSVIATPGHTPGGVSLFCGDALFCGDTLFAGSMGRTDLAAGDGGQMTASLRRLGNLPGSPTVYPGHMELTDLETERQTNPFLQQAMRE